MAGWKTEGEKYRIDRNTTYRNELINNFIEEDKYFVLSPRGMGKTIALLMKQKHMEEQHDKSGWLFTPLNEKIEHLVIPGFRLDDLWISELEKKETWEKLWNFSLMLMFLFRFSVAGKFHRNNNVKDFVGRELLDSTDFTLPNIIKSSLENLVRLEFDHGADQNYLMRDILFHIFNQNYNIAKKYLDKSSNLLNNASSSFFRSKVVYFIDSIDTGVEEFAPGNPRLWILAQNSFYKCSIQLITANQHIEIYGSLRSEAYSRFAHVKKAAWMGYICKLNYSHDDLLGIFKANISANQKNISANQKKVKKAFDMMNSEILNNAIRENENVFKYVLRHTRETPRELAIFGGAMNDRGCFSFEGDSSKSETALHMTIRDVVENTCRETLIINYIIGEMNSFLKIIKNSDLFDLLCKNIYSNILSIYDMEMINKKYCRDLQLGSWKNLHPFCELYQLGLLGTIRKKAGTNTSSVQSFMKPGESSLEMENSLPVDQNIPMYMNYFLIHPALNDYIRGKNQYFSTNSQVIVGNGNLISSELFKRLDNATLKIFISHSGNIDRVARISECIYKQCSMRNIRSRVIFYEEAFNPADSPIDNVKKMVNEAHVFVSLVDSEKAKNSAWMREEVRIFTLDKKWKDKKSLLVLMLNQDILVSQIGMFNNINNINSLIITDNELNSSGFELNINEEIKRIHDTLKKTVIPISIDP